MHMYIKTFDGLSLRPRQDLRHAWVGDPPLDQPVYITLHPDLTIFDNNASLIK